MTVAANAKGSEGMTALPDRSAFTRARGGSLRARIARVCLGVGEVATGPDYRPQARFSLSEGW